MKVVVENVQHRGGFDPEQRSGKIEASCHVSHPGNEEGVDYLRERVSLGGGGDYEF